MSWHKTVPQGPKGESGLNAYQVALREGFTGTEAEWLASLKGEKGDGSVSSVNQVLPDDAGNVELPLFSGRYEDLTNKPTIPSTKNDIGLGNVDNVKQMPITGGNFTGISKAHSNTSYTVAQVRNVTLSTSDPTGGNDGDVWIKYV